MAFNKVVAERLTRAVAGEFNYAYTDHLGSVVALSSGNAYVGGSLARYGPAAGPTTTGTYTRNNALTGPKPSGVNPTA